MIGDRFHHVLRAAQAGNQAAFEVLYEDLGPVVLGYLRGQGSLEPEDLTSEVFVALVRSVRRFRGDERAFRSWIFTIAHRRLVDERRRRSRRREDPVDPRALPEIGGADPSTEEDVLAGVWNAHVMRALHRLSEDQREVLLLRVVADLSVAQVAEVLGKTEGAVKALQRRALAGLARAIRWESVS